MSADEPAARSAGWTEPTAPAGGGLFGAGWLPETLCVLAVLPVAGTLGGVVSLGQAVSVLAFAAAVGVAALAVGEQS